MKKKIAVLALIACLISGCGSKIPTLSNGDEAVVTLKDGSKISANELYEQMKEQYALNSLVNMIDTKILEAEYPDDLEDAKSSAESTITELESYYGDQLEQAVQYYTGGQYQTKEAYKNYVYISYLQNLAVKDYAKKQINDKDIEKYYKSDIVGDIKVSHILITSKATDEMTDEEKTAAESEAKEKIESIIKELKNTKSSEVADKFAELAKEYSEDNSTKDNGGSLGFINKDTLSSAYDELVDASYKLKDGEYSTSVITTELGYHVVLRQETKEKASLDEVKDSIIEKLTDKYIEENPVVQVKALQELRKNYDLEIVDTDLQSKYATYIQNQISYYQNDENKESNDENKESNKE